MNVARHSYDVLHTEKTEIEFRMRKYEERFKQEHRSHEELQEKYRNTDKELQTAVYQLKDVLYQKDQLEVIVDNAQRREKGNVACPRLPHCTITYRHCIQWSATIDLAATLLVEQKRHESEVTELHKRIHTLKHEIEDIENGKLHNETKIKELDHFVSQLLEINSSLVAKLSGRKVIFTTHTHTHILKCTHAHLLTHIISLPLSLSLSYTHTYTHTHTQYTHIHYT